MIINWKFNIGDQMVKKTGYEYPGIVVGQVFTIEGKERYVVEHLYSRGMLHIFSPNQLEGKS